MRMSKLAKKAVIRTKNQSKEIAKNLDLEIQINKESAKDTGSQPN